MSDEDEKQLDQTDGAPPAYIQLTEILRQRILASTPDKPFRLPVASVTAKEFNVSPDTVRKATGRLKDEGLLVTRQGRPGAYVRQPRNRETAQLRLGDRVRTDAPTPDERRQHQLPRSVRMFRVTHANGKVDSYPDDRYELEVLPPDVKARKRAP
jgi:DNA-binding GntR family transcriptional regulator